MIRQIRSKDWRVDFPVPGEPYIKNVGYVKISPDKKMGSANVVEITEPKGWRKTRGPKSKPPSSRPRPV